MGGMNTSPPSFESVIGSKMLFLTAKRDLLVLKVWPKVLDKGVVEMHFFLHPHQTHCARPASGKKRPRVRSLSLF